MAARIAVAKARIDFAIPSSSDPSEQTVHLQRFSQSLFRSSHLSLGLRWSRFHRNSFRSRRHGLKTGFLKRSTENGVAGLCIGTFGFRAHATRERFTHHETERHTIHAGHCLAAKKHTLPWHCPYRRLDAFKNCWGYSHLERLLPIEVKLRID